MKTNNYQKVKEFFTDEQKERLDGMVEKVFAVFESTIEDDVSKYYIAFSIMERYEKSTMEFIEKYSDIQDKLREAQKLIADLYKQLSDKQ